jgi:hypothetical protein
VGKECYVGGHPPLLEDGTVAMGEVTDGLHGAVAEVRVLMLMYVRIYVTEVLCWWVMVENIRPF